MDKRISRQFFNNAASHWDETVRNNDPVKLQELIKRLAFPSDACVLDVGTGTGVFVPYIQSRLNGSGRVVCVDFAFRMLEIAYKKNGNEGIEHICAEIETVGFTGDVFDAAVCYSTFPHFHEKLLALANICNLLKAGGKVFICHTASRDEINAIHHKIPDLSDHLIPEEGAMREMLAAAGFEEVSITDNAGYYLAEAKRPFAC
jgi:demethylmenaquinone methyltransferase/2-methoxy-6-polyprenyl-1,4-benzoquinol methylase